MSWHRPHLERSLQFITDANMPRDAEIIDVGGGDSTLVDDLLELGFTRVTVLDISEAALSRARGRLGERAHDVSWVVADVTHMPAPVRRYDFWHDRALFHFLMDLESRRRYVEAVRRSLKPGGRIVIATFGHAAPDQCSGLPIARYRPEEIAGELGEEFMRIGEAREAHQTPWGSEQEFVYCCCRMRD